MACPWCFLLSLGIRFQFVGIAVLLVVVVVVLAAVVVVVVVFIIKHKMYNASSIIYGNDGI